MSRSLHHTSAAEQEARLLATCPWSDGRTHLKPDPEQASRPKPRQTLDISALMEYPIELSKTARKVLALYVATAQFGLDEFGDPCSMLSAWYGELHGIPQTSVKRAIKELVAKHYLVPVKIKRTYRTARRNGRHTMVYDLMVKRYQEDLAPSPEHKQAWAGWLQFKRDWEGHPKMTWTKNGYASNYWMQLSDLIQILRGQGELRRVWRLSNHEYFRSYGPIDARRRQVPIRMRLFAHTQADYMGVLLELMATGKEELPQPPPRRRRKYKANIFTIHKSPRVSKKRSPTPIGLRQFDKRYIRRDKRSKYERWVQWQKNLERGLQKKWDTPEAFEEQQEWIDATRERNYVPV